MGTGTRDLRVLVAAYGLSAFGDYLALIALSLRVHDLTGSGFAISALLLTGLVPLVVLSPIAGWLVDRFETVKVLTFTALGQAGVALGLVYADSLGEILALSFLLATGFAITQPGIFALTPLAVGEDRVEGANAALEVARWGGATLGPIAAGSMTGVWGSGSALFVNAMTFLVVGAMLPLVRARRPQEMSDDGASPRARDGLVFLARDGLLRLVVGAITAMVVFAAIDNVAEVFYAKDVLGVGDVGYGGLITSWTFGMVVGALGIGRRIPRPRLTFAVLVAAVMGGVGIGLAAAVPLFPLALGAFFIGGVANGVELVGLRTLIHTRVPPRLRGRVFAAYYGAVNAGQILAMGIGGALVTQIGARASLLLGGLGTLAVGLVGLGLYARMRAASGDGEQAPAAYSGVS